ncbi:MAG: hypothetical protein J6Y60_03160 [Treponema sp.]|nr:hypothetical protein [Treponema sp.]
MRMFGASLLVSLLYVPFAVDDGVQSAKDLFLRSLSRLASVFDLFAGLYTALYALVCVAAFGITVPTCFIIKGEGFSCIVNLIVLIALWSLIQEVIETEIGTLLEYTSFGQLFFMCSGDFSAVSIIRATSFVYAKHKLCCPGKICNLCL